MEYTLEDKVRVLDRIKDETQLEVAKDEGISRRSIANWKNDEESIRKDYKRQQVSKTKALDTEGNLGAVAEYEKQYLKKLSDLGEIEDRKKVFVAGLEKVMWDHLDQLDNQRFEDIKPDVRVKMLKDMNEIREKLSGEPSVVMEYRYKWQMVVMEVVKEMLPERSEEFLEKVKRLEEVNA